MPSNHQQSINTNTASAATVIAALRRFLPAFVKKFPCLPVFLTRAIWAILHCRTLAMGGHVYVCDDCGQWKFSFHSCNHRSCPQCGRSDTAQWVERELAKRVGAPYFMVTFTLPSELRPLFFGPQARQIYDLFFAASSRALAETLAKDRGLGAPTSGFTGILHTWNQQLFFHPHIHYIVPGAGIDAHGNVVTVNNANFLVPLPMLRQAFREHFQREWEALKQTSEWQENKHRYGQIEPDPSVWAKDWGVHIQPFGDGTNAIKYLGMYVCRSVISDSRILSVGENTVTFRWKDRSAQNRICTETIPGEEFVSRYLRHVLPSKMRAVRYFGYCHPAAKATRERIAFHTGRGLYIGPSLAETVAAAGHTDAAGAPDKPTTVLCPCCQQPMIRLDLKLDQLPSDILSAALRAPPTASPASFPLPS